MPDILLYIAPGSCSRVPLIALCETGADFETAVVRFKAGQHKSPDYRRINPKGKVPALVFNGEAITENIAILTFLAGQFPDTGLLPTSHSPVEAARQIADLSFCGTTLHPLVTRIRMPQMIANTESAGLVWDKACAAMREQFQLIEERLAHGNWWYGDSWSVMDAYLNWVFFRVEGAGFAVADYPRFANHAARMEARPSWQRAIDIEAQANALLEAEGMAFNLPSIVR